MSAALDKPATLLDAFNHYRLPQPLRQSLLDLVGAESEDDDPKILAHIPTETLEESVRGMLIDGSPPTPRHRAGGPHLEIPEAPAPLLQRAAPADGVASGSSASPPAHCGPSSEYRR